MSLQASILALVTESPEFEALVAKFERLGLNVH